MGVGANGEGEGGRVAIVAGLRTPFAKSGTVFKGLSALDLATSLISELVQRVDLDPGEIDQVVFGQVIPSTDRPNLAREIVLRTGLPETIEAYSVSRACATGSEALVSATRAILLGEAGVCVCGGADSLSRPPITYSDRFVDALMEANAARDTMDKARAFLDLKPKDFLPRRPALKELSTGLSMGESAEKMAQENDISREAQDAFAAGSHRKAAAAWESGRFDDEVMHFPVLPYDRVVSRDTIVRADTTAGLLAQLHPVFEPKYGSVTAGNSSPLADGAAGLVVMSEARAEALGFEPLAFVRSWAFAGLDPSWQLLMGPAFAVPLALDRAGLAMEDMDLVDVHEAFASQVLSNLAAFASEQWSREHLGRERAIGPVDESRLNVFGGSVALGHPFAATGARQVLTMCNELARRGAGRALVTQCAAGGLGAAVVLERPA